MPWKNKSHAERERESRTPTVDVRPSASVRGYDYRWFKTAKRHLKTEPLCRLCKVAGFIVAAVLVDHITPLSQGGTDELANRQSLCRSCHAKKTAKEQGDNAINNKSGDPGDRSYNGMEGNRFNAKRAGSGVGGLKYLQAGVS